MTGKSQANSTRELISQAVDAWDFWPEMERQIDEICGLKSSS
jgi:hypothetical protein